MVCRVRAVLIIYLVHWTKHQQLPNDNFTLSVCCAIALTSISKVFYFRFGWFRCCGDWLNGINPNKSCLTYETQKFDIDTNRPIAINKIDSTSSRTSRILGILHFYREYCASVCIIVFIKTFQKRKKTQNIIPICLDIINHLAGRVTPKPLKLLWLAGAALENRRLQFNLFKWVFSVSLYIHIYINVCLFAFVECLYMVMCVRIIKIWWLIPK